MIETVIVFGSIISLGIIAVLFSMPHALRNFAIRHNATTTTIVTVIVLWIHWGTMTGLMAATAAGLLCHVCLMFGRWWWRVSP